jgi:hypothetical protein
MIKAGELERVLSMVPEDTPVRFEIGGMELKVISAQINHKPFDFETERGKLSILERGVKEGVEDITIEVEYRS